MHPSADTTPWQVSVPEVMDTDRYLSSANAPDLEEDIRLCIASGAREMILNCAPMTYMTGAGLRVFMNIARMMSEVSGTLAVQGLTGQPRDMFLTCGMDSLIPLIDMGAQMSPVQQNSIQAA